MSNKNGKKKKNGFLKEFNDFLLRSNVIDLAVGVIIGAALKDLVASLVDNIFNPIIGAVLGNVDFSDFQFKIFNVNIKYGSFISSLINFIILAFLIFLIIKFVNKLNSIKIPLLNNTEDEEPTTKICPFCMSEIDIKATRCCHCTSVLDESVKIEQEK